MEINRYTCLRTFTYEEQQAVLAKFPEAFFIIRDDSTIDFLLPISKDDVARQFLVEWNTNQKG